MKTNLFLIIVFIFSFTFLSKLSKAQHEDHNKMNCCNTENCSLTSTNTINDKTECEKCCTLGCTLEGSGVSNSSCTDCEGCTKCSEMNCTTSKDECKDCCKKEGSGKVINDSLDNEKEKANVNVKTKVLDPVSKQPITVNEGVTFVYLGKVYTFENQENLNKFKAEPMDYLSSEEFVCPIMGEPSSKEIFAVSDDGTKYYFCCDPCIKKFKKDPDKYKDGYKE